MIIVGYQGIGKSTLSKGGNGYIDLESSNFFIDGKRAENWYIPYCNIAINLSDQGYDVFVSSHKVVREYLTSFLHSTDIVVVYPDVSLKDAWISKLKERYYHSNLNKDYRAWKNAEQSFVENVEDLANQDGASKISLNSMNYDLNAMIEIHKQNLNYIYLAGKAKYPKKQYRLPDEISRKMLPKPTYGDRCICCGEYIPEGRLICPRCEQKE